MGRTLVTRVSTAELADGSFIGGSRTGGSKTRPHYIAPIIAKWKAVSRGSGRRTNGQPGKKVKKTALLSGGLSRSPGMDDRYPAPSGAIKQKRFTLHPMETEASRFLLFYTSAHNPEPFAHACSDDKGNHPRCHPL